MVPGAVAAATPERLSTATRVSRGAATLTVAGVTWTAVPGAVTDAFLALLRSLRAGAVCLLVVVVVWLVDKAGGGEEAKEAGGEKKK